LVVNSSKTSSCFQFADWEVYRISLINSKTSQETKEKAKEKAKENQLIKEEKFAEFMSSH